MLLNFNKKKKIMKKLLSLALLVGVLTTQLTVNAMESEDSVSESHLFLTICNQSEEGVNVLFSRTGDYFSTLKGNKTLSLQKKGCILLEQPLVSLVIDYGDPDFVMEIPTEQLAAIGDSTAELILKSIALGSLSYEINQPSVLRVYNDSEEKIVIRYQLPGFKGVRVISQFISSHEIEATPSSMRRFQEDDIPLTMHIALEANPQCSIEVSPDILNEIAEASTEIVVLFQKNTGTLSYAMNKTKVAFKGTIEKKKKPSRSSYSEEIEEDDAAENGKRLGTGMDIHSGEQRNCIVS